MRDLSDTPTSVVKTPFTLYGIKATELYQFRKDGSIKFGWYTEDTTLPCVTIVLDNAWYDRMLKHRDASYEAIDICSRCKNEEMLRYARSKVFVMFYQHYSTGVYIKEPAELPKGILVFNPTKQGVI